MGIFKLKFSMNFLFTTCNPLQFVSALLVGGWWVYTGNIEIGGVVAFISGIGRLNDPWGRPSQLLSRRQRHPDQIPPISGCGQSAVMTAEGPFSQPAVERCTAAARIEWTRTCRTRFPAIH